MDTIKTTHDLYYDKLEEWLSKQVRTFVPRDVENYRQYLADHCSYTTFSVLNEVSVSFLLDGEEKAKVRFILKRPKEDG